MRATIDRISGIASAGAGVALVALTLVCAWQVFARYVLNASPGWTEPVALLLLNTVMMLGAAVAVRSEAHFGFFIAVDAAPSRLRAVLKAVQRALVLATGIALCGWGASLAIDSWSVPMAGAAMSQGWAFVPLSIGGGLMALFALERLMFPAPAAEPH